MANLHRTSIDLTEQQLEVMRCIPWGNRKALIILALDAILGALKDDPDILGSMLMGKVDIIVKRRMAGDK